MSKPNPMKGIPRDQWPGAKAKTEEVMTQTAPTPPKVGNEPIARNLFSGDIRKLEVYGKNGSISDPIPGYRLYWFLDRDNSGVRLNQAKASGYEFVMNEEVALNDNSVAGNSDLGSQVRVHGGSFNNQPVYHYLMKKPLWLHEQHQADMQRVPDRIEYELKRGTFGQKAGDGRYTANEKSALPAIDISSTLARTNHG